MWAYAKAAGKKFSSFHRRRLGPAIRCIALMTVAASMTTGFVTGVRADVAGYNPQLFASGLSGLFAAACGMLCLLLYRNRYLRGEIRRLEEQVEALADDNWELKEAEERARSL